jgi:transcriptional regulator with GAF, ATPase, and Fis domain
VSAIHALSPRKDGPLIRVNCAAIPATLIESELFGHERGSFTDATERRLGKFELAHGGTIFLDEIGEIPPEIQVKLLRVLQEKEIERIGGETCIYTDVRVIAATNRDLEKEMAAGNFRLDLYYRIHVFPIYLPPLRERKADIPLLVEHFITKYTSRHGFPIKTVSERAMQQLTDYRWPGNIRELEHLVERHVLMSKTPVIDGFSLPVTVAPAAAAVETAVKTVEEVERDHILEILRRCNGRISGRGGAAELLNIPPTTLSYRIRKLGIVWQHS